MHNKQTTRYRVAIERKGYNHKTYYLNNRSLYIPILFPLDFPLLLFFLGWEDPLFSVIRGPHFHLISTYQLP